MQGLVWVRDLRRASSLPAHGLQAAKRRREGSIGAREAQRRPSLSSCSFSEFIRRPCPVQTQFSSRPASSGTGKTRNQLAKPAVAAYTKRGPPNLHPVPRGFVFPGPGGGVAFGDTKQGAGGPFLSLQCRRERPTLRPLAAWCPPSPWPPFM